MIRRRAACALPAAVLLCAAAAAGASASGSPAPPAPGGSATPLEHVTALPEAPAQRVLPPDLVSLEQRMGELRLTSLRFSSHTTLTGRGVSRAEQRLLLAAGSQIAGEETLAPAAANVTLRLFGAPLTLRIVGGASWLYLPQLTKLDAGRRWVALGPGGLAELFTFGTRRAPGAAHPEPLKPSVGQPSYAEPPFTRLVQAFAGASGVSELGAGSVDGQPVTTFSATLRPGQLGTPAAPRRSRPIRIGHHLLRPPPLPTVTLDASLAADGMPVRIALAESVAGTTTTELIDFPEVNFPLAIEAPAAAETITLAQLRALERKRRVRRRGAVHVLAK